MPSFDNTISSFRPITRAATELPAVIRKMLEAAADADLVIGARHAVDGNPTVQGWPLWRLLMGRFGNWYFRFLPRVTARDNTNASGILAEDLQASGYAFLTESPFYEGRLGGRITEVTNLHLGRTQGESKLSAKILTGVAMDRLPPGRPETRQGRQPASVSISIQFGGLLKLK